MEIAIIIVLKGLNGDCNYYSSQGVKWRLQLL